MAITLDKTLQGNDYALHFISSVSVVNASLVLVDMLGYTSIGHYNDSFVPMVKKVEQITDPTFLASYNSVVYTNQTAAQTLLENYIVQNIPYYAGGVVSSATFT